MQPSVSDEIVLQGLRHQKVTFEQLHDKKNTLRFRLIVLTIPAIAFTSIMIFFIVHFIHFYQTNPVDPREHRVSLASYYAIVWLSTM